MLVAASTQCFSELPFCDALQKITDLEYTSVEIAIHESGNHLKPSEVLADMEKAINTVRLINRLTPTAFNVEIDASGEEYYRQFQAICKLAKASKVVVITLPSVELGMPFNEEVERFKKLVTMATMEGVLVGIKTESGRISQDPDTILLLCQNAKGLGVTLDPSHFIYNNQRGAKFDSLIPHVVDLHLRDTTKDELQVRVGQGEIDYGRIVSLLEKQKYRRALTVHLKPVEGVNHDAEMRKLRLLLESLV